MRLTTRGRHAVTALLYMALQEGQAPVPLTSISNSQGIPLPFLEQIALRLRQRGLLLSVRGPKGGYLLGRALADISVADIILAVDEDIDSRGCGGDQSCMGGQECLTHGLWQALNDEVLDFLQRTTLQSLIKGGVQKKLTVTYPDAVLS